METIKALPPGWGEDSLTESLQIGYENQLAAFSRKQSSIETRNVIDMHYLLHTLLLKHNHRARDHKMTAALDCSIRSYGAYYAACKLAFSTQTGECPALLRLCLECAAYAFFIFDSENNFQIWEGRHNNEADLTGMRKTFSNKKIIGKLSLVDHKLANTYEILYNHMVDSGAHPNFGSTVYNSDIDASGQKLQYVYREGEKYLDYTLTTVFFCGLCAFLIFRHIFPKTMSELFSESFSSEGPIGQMQNCEAAMHKFSDGIDETRFYPEDASGGHKEAR